MLDHVKEKISRDLKKNLFHQLALLHTLLIRGKIFLIYLIYKDIIYKVRKF